MTCRKWMDSSVAFGMASLPSRTGLDGWRGQDEAEQAAHPAAAGVQEEDSSTRVAVAWWWMWSLQAVSSARTRERSTAGRGPNGPVRGQEKEETAGDALTEGARDSSPARFHMDSA